MNKFYFKPITLSDGSQRIVNKKGSFLKRTKLLLLTLVIVLSGIGNATAQVSTYTYATAAGTYSAVTGTTILGNVDDGNSSATNIGFTFKFNGTDFTQFVANSNGHIRLGSTAATTNTTPISTTGNTNAIAAVARDGASTGGVIHTTTGSAPNRVCVIQYTGYRLQYNATNAIVSFQIRLYETTNVVEIIYTGASGTTATRSSQIGLRGGSNAADFKNCTGSVANWDGLAAGTANNNTVGYGSNQNATRSMPSNGRILRWTPPTPTCPTLSSPANAATGISQLPTLSWTAGANTNSYDVYLSTNQTDVNNQAVGALVSTSQAGVTYSPASLAASTTYYWRVVPKNNFGNVGSGCTTRSFTTAAPSPTITVGSLSAFGNWCVGSTSTANSFNVSGINLTANVNIAALSGYSYSLSSGGTYTSTLSIPASGTLASTPVFVKFSPSSAAAFNGDIAVSSTGATTQNVAASGTGVNTTITTQPSASAVNYCPNASATALTVAVTAANGSSFAYQWYSNTSASTSGGTTVGTNSTSYTPLTTSNGTLYYYCVVSGCGTSATSTVTGAITTGGATIPYNEPFTTTSTPNCWNITGWIIGSTRGVTGNAGNNIYKNIYGSAPSGQFNSGQIGTVLSGMKLFLDYKHSNYSSPYGAPGAGTGSFKVQVSSNGGSSYTDLATISNDASSSWRTLEYSLSSYAGMSINVRIVATWVSGDWDYGFDNFKIQYPPAPSQPSAIVGTLDPEPGSTQTYSVTNVADVSYAWVVPSTWTVTGGQGTNSITATVGTENGTISVTPSNVTGNGTARTASTTIPNYRWKYVSSDLGSATWTGGEARSIDITIKNTGVATWNTTYPNNIGVRWNSTTGSLSGTPWSDYHVRNTVGSLAPGAQGTITLAMEARNSDNAPTPSLTTNLADGTYYLAFDMVSEGQCWFSDNTGTCGPGNTVFYSAIQTVSTVPTLSCSALTAFGNVCSDATSTNSFTVSGVNLSSNVNIAALSGYSYSTSAGGSYTSTLTLTPSSGSINQSVYVKFTPGTTGAFSGNIVVSSTGATTQNVAASGTGIQAPTVNAGSDFNLCSGQTVALGGSTNATGPTLSATANSGTVTTSGTDNTNPTATYTFTGLPAGAVINGITVNITSAGGGNCPSWYSVTTRLNGVQQGVAGCATNTTYTNLNGQAANGLVVAVRGQDNDAYGDAMTVTYTVVLNYTYVGNPTYAWSPATALSATNVLTPTCSATSNTTYTLTVTGGNGCSASDQVVATVVGVAPSAPTASVSGSSTINVGGTTTLTSSAGANTLWYTAASGGSSVGSGDNWQTPVQCVAGTATYYAEDNDGTCASASRTAVSFTVRPMVVSNPANGLICQAGGSVTLSAQLTGGSAITWSPNTNLSTTSGASTVASPTTTTVYTMNATVAGCGSVSGTQTVGVIDAVAFTPTSTPASVCAGNTAALASNLVSSGFTYSSMPFAPSNAVSPTILCNACGVDDGSADNIAIPFTYNFFGNNYTTVNIGTNGVLQFGSSAGLGQFTYNSGNFPNVAYPANVIAAAAVDLNFTSGILRVFTDGIAPTRKFVIEYLNVPGYSGGSNTVQIKLCETTGIVEIHVTNSSAFGGSSNRVVGLQDLTQTIGATAYSNTATITNTAWKFIPGANYTFQWATAGANIGGATATSYTTPNLSTPGQVTYSVAATNPNTQCTTTQSVNITVNALPSAPNSSGDVTACSTAGNQSLTVSTGAGETADWFAASTGGAVLASGDNVLSYSTATAGTYYAAAQNTTTGCSSASRTGVTLNVNTSPAAPTVTTPVSYCQGAPATTLTATPTGSNTLNWYSAAPSYPAVTGATALGSAPTPSTSTAGTTNYYVSQSSSANSCESELALVAVTVNATPSAPVASNPAAYCQSASASALTASATEGNTLYWFTVPTGGTGSATAPTPSTATAGTTDYYVADRTDASGCEGSRTTVTVTVNPTITASVSSSASSTSACGGGAITFTATPTNGGTPTYQWYLNSASVSGETNATYTLATPNDADAIYVEMTPSAQTCLASSAATNSNTIPLTSTAATPTVSIQSTASTAFCPGTSVTFSVNASANMGASPTYQWNLNGTPIGGATSATLVNTTLANNDQVTLTMTSSLGGACLTQSGATSSAITSTVNSVTAISTQPAATAACLGGSTSFTVSATGTGTLTYQWKKNGSNVTGNASATTSTLTLSGIAAGDAANYTVDVTGTCGTVTSSAAALTINSATEISAQPSAVTQCAGTTANFSVTGSGQGTLSYQWRKDGSALNGETNSTLAVTNIVTINAGQYSVIVTGGCGNVTSSNALMTVNASTAISTQPVVTTLCAGNTANFSVTASGTGALSYQWKKDGTNVGTNSATLSIANTQAANAGTYTVDVSSSCGALTSNNALLTVNPLTTISSQPVGTSGCEGQNTTFTVVAAGTGSLSYQWKYGATNVGTNAASYNIPSTTTADDGNYSVVVTGGCGNATSSTVALNVYASPTTNATISTADITDATLCGKNTVAVVANSPGAESVGSWSVVGGFDISPADASATSTTFTAANSALGGAAKKLVWSHTRETSGNFCYTRDTITVDFKQPSFTAISAVVEAGDVLWNGLTDANWSTSSNWYLYTETNSVARWIRMTTGEPSSSTKVYTLSNNAAGVCVNSSNSPALGNGETAGNIYVGEGASLNLSNGSLALTGDFNNNGTINPNTGNVRFTGTANQKIKGTGLISNFNNVIVDKESGTLTLEQPTKVAGTLTMTQGDIISDATNILTIGTSSSSPGSIIHDVNNGGKVIGPLRRYFDAAATPGDGYYFPVGNNANANTRGVTIDFNGSPGVNQFLTIEYKSGYAGGATPLSTGLPLTTNDGVLIQNLDDEGYWEMNPTNDDYESSINSTPYTLTLNMKNLTGVTDRTTVRIVKAAGSNNPATSHTTWTALTFGSTPVVGNDNSDFKVSGTTTGFSWFGAGGGNSNPLPVELLSFTGNCSEGQTILTWQTASEFNSSYYSLEKSKDGEDWREINNQPAAGNSTSLLTYQFVDNTDSGDATYYRLTQVDENGESETFNTILVSCNDDSDLFKTLPNPSDVSFQVLVKNESLVGKATMRLVDTKGTVVSIKEVEITEGTNLFYLNENVTPGIYYLSISNGTNSTEVIKHSVR